MTISLGKVRLLISRTK